MNNPAVSAIRSMPWNIKDALVVFFVPWIVLPLAISVWLYLIAPYFPWAHTYLKALDNDDPKASFGLVIVEAVGSYGFIWYYLHKYGRSWKDLGWRSFNVGKALLYLLIILLSFSFLIGAVYYIVQLLYPHFQANQPQTNEFTQTRTSLSLWALVLIPPFVEEPVFRGFMFPAFSKRAGVIGGAVLSSILFGFAHLQLNVSVYTFFLGLVLCWLYVRFRSILPGIGLHLLNNYLAYMAGGQK